MPFVTGFTLCKIKEGKTTSAPGVSNSFIVIGWVVGCKINSPPSYFCCDKFIREVSFIV
jgi:hypothetical protein